MTKETRMSNDEDPVVSARFADFVIRVSFVIRHSDFDNVRLLQRALLSFPAATLWPAQKDKPARCHVAATIPPPASASIPNPPCHRPIEPAQAEALEPVPGWKPVDRPN